MTTQTKTKTQELIEKDRKYLWHPFTQMREWCEEDPIVIEAGEGMYLIDTEGRRYIDGVSSIWCNVHGHRKKEINDALHDQVERISHSTFLGLTNGPAVELAEKLVKISPEGLTRVFYSDSGSEAMEIALKMAFQYWQHKGERNRIKFVHLSEGYHGDTLGSVSVGGIELFQKVYKPLLFDSISVLNPHAYHRKLGVGRNNCRLECTEELEMVLRQGHHEICAVVMEPLMQGAAGMLDQPPGYISRVRALTLRYNTHLVFDEVATGFGRTGKMFAAEHENVSPDIMAVAKGLTGGYLPLAATLTTEKIYEAFLGRYQDFKTFFHGHTFTGNQLACRAALASLALFEEEDLLTKLQPKIKFLTEELEAFRRLTHVGEVRQVGMMVGMELVKDRKSLTPYATADRVGQKVVRRARDLGAMLRPLGNVIVLMPPLSMPIQILRELLSITYRSIEEVTGN